MSGAGRTVSVEFLGLPGVGKSTVSRNTAEYLSQHGIAAREPVRAVSDRSGLLPTLRGYSGKSLLIARELLAHPVSSMRVIRTIRATAQPSLSVLVRVTANWLMQCSQLRGCRRVPGVHLLDEGLFQALWSVGLEGRPGAVRDVARALIAPPCLPDVVAMVEADVDVVARRLQVRGGRESRADRWQRQDHDALAHASSLMHEVLDALNGLDERERPRVVHVANGSPADADESARRLAGEIERRSTAPASQVRMVAAGHEPRTGAGLDTSGAEAPGLKGPAQRH